MYAARSFLRIRNAGIVDIQLVQIGLGAEPGVIGNGQGKYHFWTVELPCTDRGLTSVQAFCQP